MTAEVKNFESIAARIASYLEVDEVVMLGTPGSEVVFAIRLGDDCEKCSIEVQALRAAEVSGGGQGKWEYVGRRITEAAAKLKARVARKDVERVRAALPQVATAQWRASEGMAVLLEPGDVLELVIRRKDVGQIVASLLPASDQRRTLIGVDYATMFAPVEESPRPQPTLETPWLDRQIERELREATTELPPASRFDALARELEKL